MIKETIPANLLTCTSQGTWRITDTRVSLDSVVSAFWAGSTPEDICQDFPSLSLVQVYNTIAYYLSHQEQVDHYLKLQKQAAEQLRQQLEMHHSDELINLRKRLLSYRKSQKTLAW
jgi:uncharacterized protein (DUF433 family)